MNRFSVFLMLMCCAIFMDMGCGSDDKGTGPGTGPQEGTIAEYFPLEVGAGWEYRYAQHGEEVEVFMLINGTVSRNDITHYQVFQHGGILSEFEDDVEFFIANGELLLSIRDDERILLKEPLRVGTSWALFEGETSEILSVSDTVFTPSGTYQNVIKVRHFFGGHVGFDYYAKNVGWIKRVAHRIESGQPLPTSPIGHDLMLELKQFSVGRNWPPVASFVHPARVERIEVGDLVTLDGSRIRDPDGDALTYRWMQTSGPPATISDAMQVRPTFTPTRQGVYVFELVVNDGKVDSAPYEETITVFGGPLLPPLTSPENVFVGLDYAMNQKDIELFEDLLDDEYWFYSPSQIDTLDIAWNKTEDVTLVGRVFEYFDKVDYELLEAGYHWIEYGSDIAPEGATDISNEHPDENWEVFRRSVTLYLLDETGTEGWFIQTDFEFKMRMDKDSETGEPIWKIVRWTENAGYGKAAKTTESSSWGAIKSTFR